MGQTHQHITNTFLAARSTSYSAQRRFDCRKEEDGGLVRLMMNPLGVCAEVMGGWSEEEYLFSEGNVFYDDRSDLKNQNQTFPAEAWLHQKFWVSVANVKSDLARFQRGD